MKNVVLVAMVGAAALVGCGGGGSGGDAPAQAMPTVAISAANQGAVARTLVDGGLAFGESQPFAANDRKTAAAASADASALRAGALQSVLRRGLAAVFLPARSATPGVMRTAAASVSTDLCSVSGSTTTTLNDVDGSQSVSAGDSLTVTFNQCQDTTDVVTGAMVFTLSSVATATNGDVQLGGGLAFVQVTTTGGARSTTIQGSVGVSAAIAATSFQLVLTVGADSLTVTSSAPGYSDTIVYEPSTQLTVTVTEGLLEQSNVALNGSFTAASIGGRVLVTTVSSLQQLGNDAYPSTGQVVVTGASGTRLRVTALNATQVQLDLDGNGDGVYEGSGVYAWGSLGTN